VVGNIVVGKRDEERALATPEAFRLALEAGMPVAVGIDCGAPGDPHATLPEELRLMVAAGATPLEALR
jgi:imidazolonepropionase-like amidohydrolase